MHKSIMIRSGCNFSPWKHGKITILLRLPDGAGLVRQACGIGNTPYSRGERFDSGID